jgi:hypothetical protein
MKKCDVAKIHRTVRWCTGLSGEPTIASANGRPRNLRVTRGRANGRLSSAPTDPEDQRSAALRIERNRAPDMKSSCRGGGAPDCPVHHPTEGKFGLPSWPPTAPSCLGAIKGTPRRMEESPKHSLRILRLPHCASAHLIDCVSDLSSVRVVNSLCYISSSSLGLCACVCCRFMSCVCCSSQPYSVLSL